MSPSICSAAFVSLFVGVSEETLKHFRLHYFDSNVGRLHNAALERSVYEMYAGQVIAVYFRFMKDDIT